MAIDNGKPAVCFLDPRIFFGIPELATDCCPANPQLGAKRPGAEELMTSIRSNFSYHYILSEYRKGKRVGKMTNPQAEVLRWFTGVPGYWWDSQYCLTWQDNRLAPVVGRSWPYLHEHPRRYLTTHLTPEEERFAQSEGIEDLIIVVDRMNNDELFNVALGIQQWIDNIKGENSDEA